MDTTFRFIAFAQDLNNRGQDRFFADGKIITDPKIRAEISQIIYSLSLEGKKRTMGRHEVIVARQPNKWVLFQVDTSSRDEANRKAPIAIVFQSSDDGEFVMTQLASFLSAIGREAVESDLREVVKSVKKKTTLFTLSALGIILTVFLLGFWIFFLVKW